MKRIWTFFFITAGLVSAGPCAAEKSNDVLLTVSGLITKTNSQDQKSYAFSFEDLQKVGDKKIQATTIDTGKSIYTGPLIRDILKTVGASPAAKDVILVGLDDYQVRVPMTDFEKWDVIVAHTLNGKRMVLETKWPLWVMYPLDQGRTQAPRQSSFGTC